MSATRVADPSSSGPPVRVGVLGPLRLVVDGSPVEVPGPKRRAVLALLARSEGRTVSVDHLLAAIWPSAVPDSGRAALESHISRLRGHLGPAADRLEARDGGYRLALGEGELDAAEARSLLTRARSIAERDPSTAASLLRRGRALWRGPSLADLTHVEPIAAWAVALGEMRRDMHDALIACAIEAAEIDDVVTLAMEGLADDPLREPGLLLLMRALAATGRERDALRAGYEYRRRLARETGLDPSPALDALEREIAGGVTKRSGAAGPGSVAEPGASLVGRDDDIAMLDDLLARERLVTIVGPGGVGKTRLALEIAHRAGNATTLPLAPVTDPTAIPHALARALDLHITHGDILSACMALLAAGPRLLVIDSCEHLLDTARQTVAALIEHCPELRILATSREPLGAPTEHQHRLAPLAVPQPGEDTAALERNPAVALFVDRATRRQARFAPDQRRLEVIAEIVRRLDGMPLAIELAARRLSSLDLDDLSARLDRSLDLLGDDPRPYDTRHRTLRTTIQWSYDLLPPAEQRLFRHLSVFPDGVTLRTAEDIAAYLDIPGDPAGALAHLVDASMINASLDTWPPRYRMLETLRAFGRDQLAAEGEGITAEEHLLDWAVDLLTWIDTTSTTEHEPEADAVLTRELPNLRTAWRTALERRDVDRATALVRALTHVAPWRELPEVWAWAEELTTYVELDHPQASTVLGAAAAAAWLRGDLQRATELALRGLTAGGIDEGRLCCLTALSEAELIGGAHAAAIEHAIEAAACSDRPTENYGVAALAAAYSGNIDWARKLNDDLESVATSPTLQAFHHYVAGEIDNAAGHADRAEKHYAQAVDLARASGASLVVGLASVGLLTLRADAGRIDEVLDGYRELIDHWERWGSWNQQWTTLRNLASLLHRCGDVETAVFLETAADHAPDAPPVSDIVWNRSRVAQRPVLPPEESVRIRSEAAASSRTRVLAVARQAIDLLRPPGQHP